MNKRLRNKKMKGAYVVNNTMGHLTGGRAGNCCGSSGGGAHDRGGRVAHCIYRIKEI